MYSCCAAGFTLHLTHFFGIRETILHNSTGLLVQPTPEGFAEAIRTFMGPKGNELSKSMGQRARQRVENEFSRESFAVKYVIFLLVGLLSTKIHMCFFTDWMTLSSPPWSGETSMRGIKHGALRSC